MKIIDLHTHSTVSDGTDTPEELVEKARERNLSAIALTDHDSVSGLRYAIEAGKTGNIEIVPGCEISTASEIGSHHILGLWVPDNNKNLNSFLKGALDRRLTRNCEMLERLKKRNIILEPEDLPHTDLSTIGRPHIAAALLKKGIVQSRQEAFLKYLGRNGLAYVPKYSPQPEKAMEALKQSGATVVLAHPLLQPLSEDTLEHLLVRLKDVGLDAVEIWHTAHSRNQMELLTRLAEKYDLLPSGGSDYHGLSKPGIQLGTVPENQHIPYQVLENLKISRQEKGLPC